MIKKPAFRYYCEFCGKSGGSASHMSRHEKYCTANPNRRCGMCDRAGRNPPSVADMVIALGDGDEAGLTLVQEMCEYCPACTLAAIRQSKLQSGPDEESDGFRVEFDFAKAKDEFWEEINDRAYNRRHWA
jgi:hypothetical protein